MDVNMHIIARIRSDFTTKFGIPRQSGLISSLEAEIVFEPEYRDKNALRGLEGFSHIWLIWQFSEAVREGWSPTVRPPRLGGNERMGVFATRSPFRPNEIGLSAVKLSGIDYDAPDGPIIKVTGADLMDGTPIFDIKPYIPYADAHPEALCGFAPAPEMDVLEVCFPQEKLALIPREKQEGLMAVLSQDPRPRYQHKDGREYGMDFGGWNIKFSVTENKLTVLEVERIKNG